LTKAKYETSKKRSGKISPDRSKRITTNKNVLMTNESEIIKKYYFVDETGDFNLFNKKGQIIVGNEGVSNFLMVGVADISNPDELTKNIDELRKNLLSDPYYKNVPSMQLSNKKTALLFHAKNDLPEIRREVFKLLKTSGIKVIAAIRRKIELAKFAKTYFNYTGTKLSENEIYDDLIKRLFRNMLHKADENTIVFSKRGESNRNKALAKAIERAKLNFEKAYSKKSEKQVKIYSAFAHEQAGLQAIDYYLWALQRFYEKGETRFFDYVQNDFRLIMDLDDKRNKEYGEWYSDKNKLDLKKIKLV